jgi:predicted transcriptional regulator
MADHSPAGNVLELTAKIVSAHVANNSVAADTLPALIHAIYKTLAGVGQEEVKPEPLVPAVPVKKSLFADYIVCLEDGKKLKMLKRHLKTSYDLTPDQYRERWGLAPNYPMVAPTYAKHRSALAKQIGLGTKASGR